MEAVGLLKEKAAVDVTSGFPNPKEGVEAAPAAGPTPKAGGPPNTAGPPEGVAPNPELSLKLKA